MPSNKSKRTPQKGKQATEKRKQITKNLSSNVTTHFSLNEDIEVTKISKRDLVEDQKLKTLVGKLDQDSKLKRFIEYRNKALHSDPIEFEKLEACERLLDTLSARSEHTIRQNIYFCDMAGGLPSEICEEEILEGWTLNTLQSLAPDLHVLTKPGVLKKLLPGDKTVQDAFEQYGFGRISLRMFFRAYKIKSGHEKWLFKLVVMLKKDLDMVNDHEIEIRSESSILCMFKLVVMLKKDLDMVNDHEIEIRSESSILLSSDMTNNEASATHEDRHTTGFIGVIVEDETGPSQLPSSFINTGCGAGERTVESEESQFLEMEPNTPLSPTLILPADFSLVSPSDKDDSVIRDLEALRQQRLRAAEADELQITNEYEAVFMRIREHQAKGHKMIEYVDQLHIALGLVMGIIGSRASLRPAYDWTELSVSQYDDIGDKYTGPDILEGGVFFRELRWLIVRREELEQKWENAIKRVRKIKEFNQV